MGILGGLRKTNVLCFDLRNGCFILLLVFDERFERLMIIIINRAYWVFIIRISIVFLSFYGGG